MKAAVAVGKVLRGLAHTLNSASAHLYAQAEMLDNELDLRPGDSVQHRAVVTVLVKPGKPWYRRWW